MLTLLKAHKAQKINYVPIYNHIYEMSDILQRKTVDTSKLGESKKKIYEAVEKNKKSVYFYNINKRLLKHIYKIFLSILYKFKNIIK